MIMDKIIETLGQCLLCGIFHVYFILFFFVAHSLIASTIACVHVGALLFRVLQLTVCLSFLGVLDFCHIRAMYVSATLHSVVIH